MKGTGNGKNGTRLYLEDIETTDDVVIPQDPLDRVIGQDHAVNLARTAALQRRHLLLVGPPGVGKSMIAQALSLHIPRPTHEIQVVQNPENPERPFIEVKGRGEVEKERESQESAEGEIIDPKEAPIHVAENLGYKCVSCGTYSSATDGFCPKCNRAKTTQNQQQGNSPFGDIFGGLLEVTMGQVAVGKKRVTTTRQRFGKEEVVVFEQAGEMIKVLDQKALEKKREFEKLSPSKVLVSVDRNPFVLATGASEVELLGDVKHDPYGTHPQLGSDPYERVVPGAIHEAHQGVLFIDELPHLGHIQRFILTAMQEKYFPISGRNPQSAGASVKVRNVPCNFIFVGACNIQDLKEILSPLRSRIVGSGYELLLETTITDTDENRGKLAQFVAQEIAIDGRIPPASADAIEAIVEVAHKRAYVIDGQSHSLTLRLRELGGLIRAAGDIATLEESKNKLILPEHIKDALKRSRPVEEQIKERYGSYFGGLASDMSAAQKNVDPYHYWNKYTPENMDGYD